MVPEIPPLTDLLAAFVADTPTTEIPRGAIEPAKNVILDTLGVALAAVDRKIGKIIIAHVAEAGGAHATATVLGSGVKTSPEMAALANGTLANALDFDDGSHLSTHILPAVLAAAEHDRCSGVEVLDAFIVAYEAAARLTQAIDFKRRQKGGPTHRGWWHVGLVGPIAAAMAVCRLRKLDQKTTANAIGIATCGGGGFRRNMGTMGKALHSGHSARFGIEAATLALHGFSGDTEIIEAPLGFMQAVVDPQDRDLAAITERLGKTYVLEGTLRIKRFPACNPGHPLIDAALRLVHERGVAADEIQTIDADLHTFSLLRDAPWDDESAGFSGSFLLAATLIHGTFTLDQLTDEVVHDARVKALMARIRHVPAGEPEQIAVNLRSGRAVRIDVLPVTRLSKREDICKKFRDCAGRALDPAAAANLEEIILTIDRQPDISRLMAAASVKGQSCRNSQTA